ncbi:MAG TPA: hypothetical protein DEA67_05090, partial [Selenomonas sp.]|nr:hypothetical protein [Selenomonas sp.]
MQRNELCWCGSGK